MRTALKRMVGRRYTFTATFQQWGFLNERLLARNVATSDGTVVTDHVWLWGRGFRRFPLNPGDTIKFTAQVVIYPKGENSELDYGLGQPTQCEVIMDRFIQANLRATWVGIYHDQPVEVIERQIAYIGDTLKREIENEKERERLVFKKQVLEEIKNGLQK